MGLNYNNSSIIGGPIDQAVLKQLEKRRERYTTNNKTSDDIAYTHANGVYVRLMSTVDVTLADGTSDSSLAEQNILLAGTLDPDHEAGSGDTPLRGGMRTQFGLPISAYEEDTERGTIPMAGITSVTITPKNSFGTVRLAKISFRLHSATQLSVFEKLYMRPGYEVLLEWGHTRWIDSDNELQSKSIKISKKSFFTPSKSETFISSGQKVRKMTDFNSDLMYGRVSNFTWSLNGTSYDCSIDIISEGNLIESLKTNMSPSVIDTDDTSSKQKYLTRMHQYLDKVLHAPVREGESITQSITRKLRNKNWTFSLLQRVNLYQFQIKKDKTGYPDKDSYEEASEFRANHYIKINPNNGTQQGITKVESFRFMAMAEFLALVNEVFMPKTARYGNLIRFFTGDFSTVKGKPKTPFLTFGGHLALDPRVALLPKSANNNSPYVLNWSKHYNKNYGATHDILQIYLNVEFVYRTLSEVVTTPDASVKNVLTLVNSVLDAVQHCLGGVNDFDIQYEEDSKIYYVVDRKIVPGKEDIKNASSKISLSGLGSSVEEVKVQSKLTPGMATMVAVSATATHSDAGDDFMHMQKWNQGLKNRHFSSLRIANKEQEDIDTAPKANESLVKGLKDFVKNTNTRDWAKYRNENDPVNPGEIIESEVNSYREIHSSITSDLLQTTIRVKKENPPGLIPLELSFKMKGISGLKIGQSFIIADESILPEKYRGNVGFLITGISHNIDSNKWMTEISTQMIVLQKFVKEVQDVTEEEEEQQEEQQEQLQAEPNENPSQRQPVAGLHVGEDCVDLVKYYEGFRANAYRDPGSGNQPITIGYGTTRINGKKVQLGDVITEPRADHLMRKQLDNEYGAAVRRYCKVPLTQYEFDALSSLCYNIGPGNFKSSTLLRKVNSKDYIGAANRFGDWNKSKGVVMRGLVKRRAKEAKLFLKESPGNTAA